jgi:type II secretory pathway pseudopilin PulG
MATSAIPQPPAQSHAVRNLGLMVIVIIIVLMSVLVLGFRGSRGAGDVTQSTQTFNIVNSLITVNAGDYEYYQLYVPSGATNVQVQGSFTASGGFGNNIEVLIMDTTDFINWQTGHQANAYYDSGQLTTSNFDVHLPSGSATWYLVYSNTFSFNSQKNVNTQANLSYST